MPTRLGRDDAGEMHLLPVGVEVGETSPTSCPIAVTAVGEDVAMNYRRARSDPGLVCDLCKADLAQYFRDGDYFTEGEEII